MWMFNETSFCNDIKSLRERSKNAGAKFKFKLDAGYLITRFRTERWAHKTDGRAYLDHLREEFPPISDGLKNLRPAIMGGLPV